jgi:catechol-2,3-dioxygenase
MTRPIESAQPVSPVRFAHFVLRVRDLDASIAWYRAVLGMEVVHRAPFIVFMTYDDEHHRLAMVEARHKEELPAGAPGLDHVAYTLASLGDLLGTYERLKGQDILPVWPINHGLTTSLYYADPDGNRVEFQVENFATEAELNNSIRGEAFAANPIGTGFDPERLLERYRRGDPVEELVLQGSA